MAIKLTFNGTTIHKPGAYSSGPISKLQLLALSISMRSADDGWLPKVILLLDKLGLGDRL